MTDKYNIMKQNFSNKNCELLTTLDEYINDKMKTIDKYLVKAKCGHVHLVYYHMFLSRNSGIICKECIAKKNAELVHTNNNISSKTFASKKADIHKTFKELPYYKYYDLCIKCNSFMQKSDNNICIKCYNEKRANYDKLPSLEQLEYDVKTINYVQTGKKYGVSDNTIRKWIKKLRKKKLTN